MRVFSAVLCVAGAALVARRLLLPEDMTEIGRVAGAVRLGD